MNAQPSRIILVIKYEYVLHERLQNGNIEREVVRPLSSDQHQSEMNILVNEITIEKRVAFCSSSLYPYCKGFNDF